MKYASVAHFAAILALCITCNAISREPGTSIVVPPETDERIIEIEAFNVTGERLEDFGFRVSHSFDAFRSKGFGRVYTPVVDVVLPNTAASKAGLRPGDRIVASDGASTACDSSALREWRTIQKRKWSDVATGIAGATWKLQVESAGTAELRMINLELPTPPPHWGSSKWRAPQDRTPLVISENGVLTARAEQVFNNGIWTLLRESYTRGLQLPTDATKPYFLCYQWTLWEDSVGHRIYVSQQRGRIDIILEAIQQEQRGFFSRQAAKKSPDRNLSSETTVFAVRGQAYLTSPSGELLRAHTLSGQKEISLEAARPGFEAELRFWLTKVGKRSALWPLEIMDAPTQ
jgi:hypothetical protein